MNDPNKKIDVNLSSLLSLKAELLRKQAEVSKVKATRSGDTFVPSKAKTYKKESISEVPSSNGKDKEAKVYEVEDSALLEKSQRVLQAKSKYYDRMTAMGGQLNSDDNCLVLFNRKKQEDPIPATAKAKYSSSSDDSDSDDDDRDNGPVDPEDEWVEYTDCLGRTRKCLRRDLDFIKKKDTELAASIPERLDQTQPNWMLDVSKQSVESTPTESVAGDGASVMSKHDEMRNNWEKKEVENLSKENVHYQDVFFDEARQHGVGYYAFSTDEDERARQQKELEETRLKTLNEQAQREAQRNQREKIIAERVRAAKNRQRARLGLPPLEDEPAVKETDEEKPPETKAEKKQRKREEKLKRKQEKADKLREEERKNHVRPWDKEKDGVRESGTKSSESEEEQPWAYRPDRAPMSQEEWNERKRLERNPEFAPGAEEPFRGRERKRRDLQPDFEAMPNQKVPRTSFRSGESLYPMAPPPPPIISEGDGSTFAPFQSTKKTREVFHRRNYNPFANSDNEEVFDERRGAEIPPPVDLDPEPFTRPKTTSQSLENSIEAGLKFLRNNFDKTTLSNKASWAARSDY